MFMKSAKDLLPGDMIDLEPYWTREYDESLAMWAECEYGVVQMAQTFNDGMAIVWLEDGPSNVLVASDHEFEVVK